MVNPLKDALRNHLGSRFNEDLESIYTRAFNYLTSTLERAFDMQSTTSLAPIRAVAEQMPEEGQEGESQLEKEKASLLHDHDVTLVPRAARCPVLKLNGRAASMRCGTVSDFYENKAEVKAEIAVQPTEAARASAKEEEGCGSASEVCLQKSNGETVGLSSLHKAAEEEDFNACDL